MVAACPRITTRASSTIILIIRSVAIPRKLLFIGMDFLAWRADDDRNLRVRCCAAFRSIAAAGTQPRSAATVPKFHSRTGRGCGSRAVGIVFQVIGHAHDQMFTVLLGAWAARQCHQIAWRKSAQCAVATCAACSACSASMRVRA